MPDPTMPDTATTLVPFRMPSLGADMDAGSMIEWQVQPGSAVRHGDVVAIVRTDKSDLDLEVFVDGTIAELIVPAGVRVPVGTVLATIAAVGAVPHEPAWSAAPATPDRVTPAAAAPSTAAAPAHAAHELHSPVLRR